MVYRGGVDQRLKVLFVGLGSIGQRHVRNLRALLGDRVELLAYRQHRVTPVLNPDMTVRQGADVESTYDITSFAELDQALDQRPDAVFITNPNTLHLSIATRAAEAGLHLFIEKPVSHSLDGVAELKSLVERQGLVAFVGYQFRFHPGLKLIKSTIGEGGLGRLIASHIVNAEFIPDWHPYEDYRGTHAARRDLGGGCLNIQTHEIDYATWLFGMPRRVFAVGGHLSNLEVDVEDSVSVLMECESDGRPLPVHIHLDYLQRPPQRLCEVVGDAGRATYDYYAGKVEVHDAHTKTVKSHSFSDFDRNQMFLDELKHFIACVRGEAVPAIDLREGMRSLMVGLAAHESLRTGASVEVQHV
jgi:predicted dehydrogenase